MVRKDDYTLETGAKISLSEILYDQCLIWAHVKYLTKERAHRRLINKKNKREVLFAIYSHRDEQNSRSIYDCYTPNSQLPVNSNTLNVF